jgi:zinc protease
VDPWQVPPAPAPQAATRVYLVDKPGAAQSQIRIGHVGIPRVHRDYYPLLVLNTILGGQFTSRINLNLREDKGYSYGARSAFQMGRIAGPFVASAGVETAVTRESVVEFMRELEEIRGARPVTAEELDFARASIVRREPLTLETNAQIAGRIQDLILYGLPDDYFDEYNRRVAAVTLADVNRVAREYLQPDRFAIVVVGDRAVVEAALRQLPYPVEVVAVEGQATPVPPGAGTGGG